MKARTWNWWMLLLVCLAYAFAFSCNSHEQLAGTYDAQVKEDSAQYGAYIDLKEGGTGLWVSGAEEVEFKWDAKEDELRLNTKGGGVLLGRIRGDVIEIKLPGGSVMLFKKKE